MRAIGIVVQAGICIVLLAARARVPDIVVANGGMAELVRPPEIVGGRSRLSPAQSNVLIDRYDRTLPGDADVLRRHLETEPAIAETPLIAGDRIQIIYDDPGSFHATFAAIARARHNINIESFIVEDVVDNGQSLGDLLIAKRGAGVTVNVIYDSFGASATPAVFFTHLREAGVNPVDFNPLNPLTTRVAYA